jgi:hypothetical protein
MDIEITPLEPVSPHRETKGDEEDTGEETPVNKKLVALSIGVAVLLLLGGIQTSFLYGTQFLYSKSEYNFSVAATSAWWDCNWSYAKKITIDHTKVQADETNFPVLLYEATDADLAAYAQENGNDIVFVDRWNVTQYHHELEKFDGDTGELWAWVNVTSLSSTQDTILYMYYGNPDCGSQQRVPGTWDAGFAMVQHLAETSGSYDDATSHGNDGNPVGAFTRGVVGKIDGAVGLDGTTGSINTGTSSSLNITNQITLEGWVQDPPVSVEKQYPTINAENRIEITNAVHLDVNKHMIADVSNETVSPDNNWSEPIQNGEYLRVTFEQALNIDNDIIVFVRSQGTSQIKIFTKDDDACITTIKDIVGEQRYHIFLINLSGNHTTFDLETSGDAVEYNYIVDPTGWVSPTGFADPTSQWTAETRAYDDNIGTYASHLGAAGWRGFLELSLSSAIYCNRVRVFSDFGGVVDRVSVDIYNSTSWIEKYNGTISNCAWAILNFSAETNVTKARFRYHYTAGGYYYFLYEFDFWQGQPVTLPKGTTLNATSIDETTVIVQGNVSDDGGEPCQYRFQYGTDTFYGSNTTWSGYKVKNEVFTLMIHNLTLGQTYQYRVQVKNSVGTANGSNKNFTTATPSLGWVTPTSHNDPNSQWSNEVTIYDDDTNSYTQSFHDVGDPDGQWSFFIYVNHSMLLCDKVRFYARGPTGDSVQVDQADLDVKKGGVWVDVYNGTFSDRQWIEKKFTQGSIDQARIRFHINSNTGGLFFELYEFDFNKSRPVPMLINEIPTNRSWGIALRPQMNLTVNNPDGASMTVSWYSNTSGSWQLFGTNSSVGNGTYHQRNNNFSSNNTKYWWKVSLTDGTDMNSSWYYFSTRDSTTPISNVVAIAPYWKKSASTIMATASDPGWSGVKNVTLYYRYCADNSSWGGWTSAGTDTASPWSWSFTFSNGTGYYQFYSIAIDNASNTEAAPGSADAKCAYETNAPSSSVSSIAPYWKTSSPQTLSGTASDIGPSGLKNVTLRYRYRATNTSSWGGWANSGLVDIDPWVAVSWSFTFSNGSGYYEFYSIANDNATNYEAAPGSADTSCGYDNLAPTSSLADGNLSDSLLSTYEWNGAEGRHPAVVRLGTSDYYLVASEGDLGGGGSTFDGWLYTIRVWSNNGTIQKSLVNSWEYDSSDGFYPSICLVNGSSNIYAITYEDAGSLARKIITTRAWSNNGTLQKTILDTLSLYRSTITSYSRILNVNGNIYAVAYVNNSDGDGRLATCYINSSGDIGNSVNDTLEFNSSDALNPQMCLVDNNTVAIVYDGGTAGSNDGYLVTYNISSTGDITNTYADQWEFDPTMGTTPNIFKVWDDSESSGVNRFVIGYEDTNSDLYMKTCVISDNGVITKSWTDTQAVDTTNGDYCSLALVGYNSSFSSKLMLVAFSGESADGYVSSFDVTNSGLINSEIDTLEFDSADCISRPRLIQTGATSVWLVVYEGTGNDGWSSTFTVLTNGIPYWKTTSPFAILGVGSERGPSGLKNVTLWYRFRATNISSWGGWVSSGLVDSDPWVAVSWSFTFLNGTGYYQFYSIARDNVSNTESAPGSADFWCGFDNQPPSSSVNVISPYWQNTTPLTISATANDSSSGVKNVTLYYRFSSNNASWGGYVSAGVDTTLPWSWSFGFPNGTGYYQFYSIAINNATNAESAPGSADVWCGYETAAPSSSVDAISPYWKIVGTIITATASDALSGVKNVTLSYRFSSDNSSWGGYVSTGVDTASPWSWSFNFSNGTGYYQFYSVAKDNATNTESVPGSADAQCGYDNLAPSSSVNTISSYWKKATATVSATASDSTSGVKNVTLYYRFSYNNGSWGGYVNAGVDAASPWSWSFGFSNGSGYYQFYSNAKDNATNTESAPGSADALCGYDNLAPTSNVTVISPYWKSSSPQTLTGTASDTLYERYNTGDDGGWGGGGTLWKCQTFTVGNTGNNMTHFIASVKLKLFRTGSPGTMTVGIRATNATGYPTGSDLTNGTIDGNTLTTDSQGLWYQINFTTPYALSQGTKYAIVVRAPNALVNNQFTWRFDSTSPTYSGGSYINGQNSGTIWGINLGLDLMFEEYSVPLSGLKNVTLYYRYRATNSTGWGGWTIWHPSDPGGSNPITTPWLGISWSFNFPNGTGNYQFYSIAKDNATNTESSPGSTDASCGYDNGAPTSSVNAISPYWKNAAATVTAIASDTPSDVKNVTLWYRFSNNNASWGGWVNTGVDSASPWSWSVSFSNGTGYYQFYSIARDNALNVESAPGSADASCGYDITAPSSSVNSITPYRTKSPTTITATANDALSGVKNVTLWYRFSDNNASWGGWVSASVDTAFPWSWSFIFQNGTGYYQFFSIARDNATNTESASGSADAWCWCDNEKPSSSVNTISPYMVYSSPLTINATASDSFSGVKNVTIWYRFSIDNSTWGASWYNANWMYRKKVTIDHTKVAATLTNFPILVSITDVNLYAKAQSNGNDILFTTSTGTKLNHEIESYTSATGALVAWVNVTSVSSTADTVIYMYYGNPSASNQQNRAGTWDSNYAGVWHLKESSSPYNDSTGNNDNSTSGTYPTRVTGQIGYAQNFTSASSQYISFGDVAPLQMRTYDWTTSAWIKTSSAVEAMVSKAELADNWQMRITATGLAFLMMKQGVGSANTPDDGSVITNGVWHYVIVRVVRSDKIYRYVDGSHTGTDTSDAALNGQNISNDRKAEIGARDLIGNQNFFNGIIDEVRISKIARSANWISTEYNNQYSPSTFVSIGAEEPWRKWNDASNPDTSSPWSWNFNFSNGTGYYQFYSIANDTVGNEEDGPSTADARCHYIYDVTKPSSSVTAISSLYWKTTSPLMVSAAASDTGGSGLKNVTLYYYNSSNNATWYGPWNFGAVTNPWAGISWSFTFPKGVGYYRFYSIAMDNASNTEGFSGNDTRCAYDNVAPTSSIDAISPYWKTATATITATASDATSGMKNVTLWYRFSSNNASWGGWVSAGVDGAFPWSWSFSFSNGTGYYQFYSIARDNATNAESAPGSADAMCGYDNVAPSSSISTITPYLQLQSPLTISATASDSGPSGLKNVTLHYRYSSDNSSWAVWTSFGIHTAPWSGVSWSFTFSNGSGYYEFYSIAGDNATNQESAPGGADAKCRYLPLAIPTVVTNASTGVEETNATLHGYLQNDGGEQCTVRFQYGTTTSYGTNTTNQSRTTGYAFQQNITGLTPGHLYHFRAYANNTRGGTIGSDATFLTKPDSPTSFIAQGNTSSKIYLTWTKGTGANTTRIQRKTGGYPTNINDGNNVYNLSGSQVEETGLTPGVTYYYRAWSYSTWNGLYQWSDGYASATVTTKNMPVLNNENPANGSVNVALNTTLSIHVIHGNGYQMNISWYWGTTSSCPNFIGRNTSVTNGSYGMSNDGNFSSNSQIYYWRVTVNDGHGEWSNATYHFSSIPPNKKIISKGREAYALEINPGGTLLYGYINGVSVQTTIDTSWHYVTLTYDGSHIRLYEDGILRNSTTLSGNINTNAYDLLLGEYLSGKLDEVRVSSTARSAAWINTTFLDTNSPATFATFGSPAGVLSTWAYRKKVSIDHSLVSATLSNFPVLVFNISDVNLQTSALSTGNDIIFMGSTESWITGTWRDKLDFEIEKFDHTTGELEAWVRIPTLSASADTNIYMYYGNALCNTNRQNPTGVWDSNYCGVWHLRETGSGAAGEYVDSTVKDNDGRGGAGNSNRVPAFTSSGRVDGANAFDGVDDSIDVSGRSTLNITGSLTLEAWVHPDVVSSHRCLVRFSSNDTSPGKGYFMELQGGQLHALVGLKSGGTSEILAGSIPASVWTYTAVTWNASVLKGFINGYFAVNSSPNAYDIESPNSLFRLGSSTSNTSFFDGILDEVRISSTARSAGWINTTYQTINRTTGFLSFGRQLVKNVAPTQGNPSPSNGATQQSLNPCLQITINDSNQDALNVTFRTNASGLWAILGTNTSVTNGSYQQQPSTMNYPGDTYYWSANVTDGLLWTNETYHFTTVPEVTFNTTSSDGYTQNTSGSYATTYDAVEGTVSSSAIDLYIGQAFNPPLYTVYRGFVFFDTSAIPDGASITSASLSLYGDVDASDQDFFLVIQNGQPTNPHDPLAPYDYYHGNYSGNGGSFNTSGFSISGYNNITLNATGRSWINKTGMTKLCLRSNRDIFNVPPTMNEFIRIYANEKGNGFIPRLLVVYSQ